MAFPSFVINFLQGFSLHFYSKILLKMDVFLSKCGHCGGFSAILRRSWQRRLLDHWRIFFFVSLLSQTLDNVVLLFRRHSISVATADADPTFLAVDLVEIDVVFASSRFVCLFVFFLFFPPPKFFPISVCGPRPMPRPLSDKRKRKRKAKEKKKGNYLRCTRSASRGR